MKVCFSEPSLLIEKTLDHLIKRTAGITVLQRIRVQINFSVCHIDVDLSYPFNVVVKNGWTVRPLKRYMNWVQNDVNQFGFYLE